MPDWLNSLTQGFMPHGYCLRWDAPLLMVLITSNIGIAVAYFAIPMALRKFIGRRQDLPYPHMFKLFAAFILSCGITHLVKVGTLYYPVYWAEAVIDAWTAAISLTTAAMLYPLIPHALALRSPKALEESHKQLEAANHELESVNRELGTVAENLRTARDQALEASNLKSAFIANVSHELRTPLSGVLGMNELLLSTNLGEDQRMMAETVHDSARTLLALVNDILDLSKIEAGKMTIESIPMHPAQIAEDVKELLQTAARGKGVSLSMEIAPDVPKRVLGDPVRIHQVLLNLVGNAVKFTHHGGVSVRVFTEFKDELRTTVRFEVEDTGIGISDEEARLLFLPFTQADMSTTRRYGGTGLGLTISKRLVELMGGDIAFSSLKGRGSKFWFSVPFKTFGDGDDLAAIPTEAGGAPILGNILVVEDNQMMQTVVSKQLSSLGVGFLVVGSAELALEALERSEFGMILMDCHLPAMDGFEATRAIREREKTSGGHIPVVAMTAGAMKGDPEKCIAAGMDDYLAKPYTLDQLREILKKWLPQNGQSFAPSADPNNRLNEPTS